MAPTVIHESATGVFSLTIIEERREALLEVLVIKSCHISFKIRNFAHFLTHAVIPANYISAAGLIRILLIPIQQFESLTRSVRRANPTRSNSQHSAGRCSPLVEMITSGQSNTSRADNVEGSCAQVVEV